MARPKYPSDSQAQFMLRLPEGMREQIKQSAEESGRSMNAEILEVLREYFPADPELTEIADQLRYAVGMLKEIEKNLISGGSALPGSVIKTVGLIQSANDDLEKVIGRSEVPTVVALSKAAVEKLTELEAIYQLGPDLLRSTASDLIVMSAEQVLRREARLRVHIGEGEATRVVEIKFPDET